MSGSTRSSTYSDKFENYSNDSSRPPSWVSSVQPSKPASLANDLRRSNTKSSPQQGVPPPRFTGKTPTAARGGQKPTVRGWTKPPQHTLQPVKKSWANDLRNPHTQPRSSTKSAPPPHKALPHITKKTPRQSTIPPRVVTQGVRAPLPPLSQKSRQSVPQQKLATRVPIILPRVQNRQAHVASLRPPVVRFSKVAALPRQTPHVPPRVRASSPNTQDDRIAELRAMFSQDEINAMAKIIREQDAAAAKKQNKKK